MGCAPVVYKEKEKLPVSLGRVPKEPSMIRNSDGSYLGLGLGLGFGFGFGLELELELELEFGTRRLRYYKTE